MSFRIAEHLPALLLALIPLILHLLRKRQARRVEFSSLTLLMQRGQKPHQSLKLRRILLLLTRMALAFLLASWFLKPILQNAPHWLASAFPSREEAIVYLDTRLDEPSILQNTFNQNPKTSHLQASFRILTKEDFRNTSLVDALLKRTSPHKPTWLVSRAYGLSQEDVGKLAENRISIIPHADAKTPVFVPARLEFSPKSPLGNEQIELKASFLANFSGQGELSLKSGPNTAFQMPVEFEAHTPLDLKTRFLLPAPDSIWTLQVTDPSGKTLLQKTITLNPREKLHFVLVHDGRDIASKTSRLYYLNRFLLALQKLYQSRAEIRITTLSSEDWLKQDLKPDWLILGELTQPVLPPPATPTLVFTQSQASIQDFYNRHFSITSFGFSAEPRLLMIPQMNAADRGLMNRPIQIRRRLLFKSPGLPSILNAGQQPLIIRKDAHYFSGLDFVDTDFDGIAHPFFPVFLMRLFLNRFSVDVLEEKIDLGNFERDETLLEKLARASSEGSEADISTLILVILLIFAIAEIRLIRSLLRTG